MDRVKLPAGMRLDMSKSRLKEMRRNGLVPANLSGKDVSAALEINLHDLVSATKTDAGIHALMELKVEGDKAASGIVMIKKLQKDPLTRRVLHVDLQRVSLTEKIVSPVPIEIVGESHGQKEGGILEAVLTEVHVRALPMDLPPRIEVDATEWNIGQVTRAGDLLLPPGVELVTHADETVATLRPPHIHVIPTAEVPEEAEALTEEAKAEAEQAETEES